MLYLHFPNDPVKAAATKTVMSAADAIRQKADWRAQGVEAEVRTGEGTLVTDDELRDWKDS